MPSEISVVARAIIEHVLAHYTEPIEAGQSPKAEPPEDADMFDAAPEQETRTISERDEGSKENEPSSVPRGDDHCGLRRFRARPLARFLARVLLGASAQRMFALNDFLDVWQLALLPLLPDYTPTLDAILDFVGCYSDLPYFPSYLNLLSLISSKRFFLKFMNYHQPL